jgi:hypothetical protein
MSKAGRPFTHVSDFPEALNDIVINYRNLLRYKTIAKIIFQRN